MFLVLAALILRPVGVQVPLEATASHAGARIWDWALFIGGFVPALVFGVAVGNVLLGAPFRLDSDLRVLLRGQLPRPVHALHPALRPAVGGHAGAARRGLAGGQGRARAGAGPGAPVRDRRRRRQPRCCSPPAACLSPSADWASASSARSTRSGLSNPLRTHGRRCAGRLARQLRPLSVDADRAGPRLRRRGRSHWSALWRRSRSLAFGGSSASARRDHRDRRPVDVPLHPAQHRSTRSPA